MFKELLKAKRRYYGDKGFYPTAIKMNTPIWNELKAEGKAISLKSAHGLTSHSVNGMEIFIDETVSGFEFGFIFKQEFHEEVF